MLTKIVDWIIGQKVISPTQRELYEYAVQCFFVTAIPFVISVLLSILLHMLAACVCFTLAFMLIRKFGGEYHAKRTWVCMISSSVAMVTGSCLAQWVVIPFAVLTPMIVAAGVEIWINSPIDSENRRLTLEEKRDCRQMVRWLSVVAFTAYVMLRYAHQDILASAVGLALVLAASTQVLAGIQQMREKR